MSNSLEITKDALNEFKEIQEYMALAKDENALKTYDRLKEKYLYLKALLNTAGVNLAEIDKIKE
ncbi:MAG: hypothetical protein IJ682_05490 [Lachnospiraceae bacterium]|nr:hypothetical protein [Lachnospiraceae bacterium]